MSVERQLIMASGNKSTQYTIANSLRFRASASAYLNRTPASAGNRQTFTWSGWIKLGALGVSRNTFFTSSSGSATNYTSFIFATDQIRLLNYDSGTKTLDRTSTPVYRDPSAWYHVVIAFDMTQATATNRQRVYINGVEVTAWTNTTTLAQNSNTWINYTQAHYIYRDIDVSNYFDGYLAEVNFIDGQALTPSSFGETSTTTGVWIPKKYTGTYGTNGFYLNFSNGTSTTTLGYDSSSNGNNWTTNNISLTTGSTYDWMIDSPTSFAGSSYGVGNYSDINALDCGSSGYLTTSNANLEALQSSGLSIYRCGTATIVPITGKFYCEFQMSAIGGGSNAGVGVIEASHTRDTYAGGANGGVGYLNDGRLFLNSVNTTNYSTFTTSDIVSVAVDYATGKVWFGKNNVWQNGGDPVTGTGQVATLTPANQMAICGTTARGSSASGTTSFIANFGQRPFAYTPPSGYKSLCTQNLSDPSILIGNKYMDATLYTGTGSSLSVTNAGAMQPDFVWIKSRSAATDHALYDVIRGTQARLESNTTDAEVTSDNGLTAFGSSGFTVNTLAQVNTSSATYVGWQWKAGGTAVTNTAGSITSSVSANTTAGFSVVTYTGTGSAATVGHGLGVAPSMIIIKSRSSGSYNWMTYHASVVSFSNGKQWLALNTTDSLQTNSTATTFTSASSTTFGLGDSAALNASGGTYVAYCFAAIAGYSAFGSYAGNGSADGPFVYCGFRPRYVLVKRSDTGGTNWWIEDSARNTYNPTGLDLGANVSDAEINDAPVYDFLSNGFKLRNGSFPGFNASGGTYIYAAFAENPFKNSLAR